MYSFSYISQCRNGRVVTVSFSQGVPWCKLMVRVPSDIFFSIVFLLLDRCLMISWISNSWNRERVSSVFTFMSVCVWYAIITYIIRQIIQRKAYYIFRKTKLCYVTSDVTTKITGTSSESLLIANSFGIT